MLRQRGRLTSIDLLRGIAVLAVLLNHLPHSARLAAAEADGIVHSVFPHWVEQITRNGQFGVHLFLVLSGFCIHMQWARRAATAGLDVELGFGAFWKRRLRRLYPPYAAALVLTFAGLFFFFHLLGHARGLAPSFGYASTTQLLLDLALLLLLLQNVNGASHRVGNGPFWSLALEEQLYLLYFPLLWLRRRFGWQKALLAMAALTLAWRSAGLAMGLSQTGFAGWYALGPARWLEWGLGALAAEAYLGMVRLPTWTGSAAWGLALLALAVGLNAPALQPLGAHGLVLVTDLSFGLAFFVLTRAACQSEERARASRIGGFLAWMGGWSYSLYLVQEPVLVGAKQVAMRMGLGTAGVVLFRFSAALAAGYLFHRLIEARFMNPSRTTETKPSPAIEPLEGAREQEAPSLTTAG